MDTRVGYPNEHLAGDSDKEITSPLFATSVGLVMDGLQRIDKQLLDDDLDENSISDDSVELNETGDEEGIKPPPKLPKPTTSFLDKLTDRLKDFLDNAE